MDKNGARLAHSVAALEVRYLEALQEEVDNTEEALAKDESLYFG